MKKYSPPFLGCALTRNSPLNNSTRHLISFFSKNAGTSADKHPRISRIGCTPGSGKFLAERVPPGRPVRKPCKKRTVPFPIGSAPG